MEKPLKKIEQLPTKVEILNKFLSSKLASLENIPE